MEVLVFILGSILGSFYLVIATRLPLGEDIITSRSHCDSCKKELKWYNLIPIFSFLWQRGRCSNCNSKISMLNIIIELVCGILFLLGYLYYGFDYSFYIYIILISLMIIIFISDFSYMIILDSPLIISGILIIIIKAIYLNMTEVFISIISAIILFFVMLLIQKFGEYLFKKEALGGGDIKFAAIIGLVLGYRLGLVALILSTFLALPYSVASMYLTKNNEVPFGPFLVGALVIVFIFIEKFSLLIDLFFSI